MSKAEEEGKDKLAGVLMGVMKKVFEADQEEPFQYAVAYRRVSDDSLLGYHGSTWCDLVKEKVNGKRYNGENPYAQLEIISKNVKNVLEVKEDGEGLFDGVKRQIKKQFYDGLTYEDIYLEADYLEEGTPPQKFVFQKISP